MEKRLYQGKVLQDPSFYFIDRGWKRLTVAFDFEGAFVDMKVDVFETALLTRVISPSIVTWVLLSHQIDNNRNFSGKPVLAMC